MASTGTILVVDDELALRKLLSSYLIKEGFGVLEARDGQEALSLLEARGADLALVDIMMPGMDGFSLVKAIRSKYSIPIVMLTARGEETSKVTGLELGADDYVVKPFSAPEVIARVRAQIRRSRGLIQDEPLINIGDALVIDSKARQCWVDNQEIQLSRREFDLLMTLASSPGRVFSRESLLMAAWGTTFITEKTIDVHIGLLRKKLGQAITITSLRGIGYRLDG